MAVQAKSFVGDRDALCAAILEAAQNYVLATTRSIAEHRGMRSQAEDISQTVLLRFFQKWKCGCFPDITWANWCEPDQQRLLKAWFFVATLRVAQEFRWRNRRDRPPGDDANAPTDDPPAPTGPPLLGMLIQEGLETCSPAERKVLAFKVQGYFTREIASLVGIADSTVRGHLASGRHRLQAYLNRDDEALPTSRS